jgi:hypothetical protein
MRNKPKFIPEMEGQTRIRFIGTGRTINGVGRVEQTFKITEVLQNGNAFVSLVDDNRTMKLSKRVMEPKEMTIFEFRELCP